MVDMTKIEEVAAKTFEHGHASITVDMGDLRYVIEGFRVLGGVKITYTSYKKFFFFWIPNTHETLAFIKEE